MNLPSAIVSSPPRDVPLSTRIVTLLGGPLNPFGWIFFGFGMLFVFGFIGDADLTSWYLFRGQTETAQGIVTAVEKTNATEGGDKHGHGGTPIYAYSYHFTYSQTEHQGVSYRVGMAAQAGATVTVEFPKNHPDISRIQNMRRNVFGPSVMFVLLFPLIGLIFIIINLTRGRKNLSLLANGEHVQAVHTDKEATRTQINKRTVYKVWFEFTDLHGELQKAFTKTINPGIIEGTGLEPLFYNRQSPSQIVLLRDLPRDNATLDERGQVSPCGLLALLKVLWPPLLGLAFIVAGWVLSHHIG